MFETVTLSSVCTIVKQTPPQFDGYKQYVATADLQKSEIISSTKVTYENRPSRADSTVRFGDVLFAKMAGTEKTLIAKRGHQDMLFSTGFAILRPTPEILDSAYLYHILRSEKFLLQKDRMSSGATQKAITNKALLKIKISIPPISEQKRIAIILDKAHKLKSDSEQSKLIRQSLIRSTFVDMFEVGIENETHLPLEQICKIVDCPHSTPMYSDDPTGYYCVRSQDLTDEGELIFDKMMQVTRDTFENRISRHTPKAGDVLFLREGSIGRCAIIPNDVEICLGQRIMILSPDKNIVNPTFLHYLILSDRFQHSLSRFKLGTTAGRVNIKELRGLLIPIPELSRQVRFQKFVNLLNGIPNEEELFSRLSKSLSQEMLT